MFHIGLILEKTSTVEEGYYVLAARQREEGKPCVTGDLERPDLC
jgi:hypothetical protein